MDLSKFNSENLFHAATELFGQLGVRLNSNTTSAMTLDNVLKENRGKATVFDSVRDVYFLGIVDDSVFKQSSMFESGYTLETGLDEADRSYDGLMIFAVDLDHRPTRTDLSTLTRAFNRISKAMPVAVLAKYSVDSEAVFSLAISERFKYSQTWREGEKVGKIILLKDVRAAKTHAGHQRILLDLTRTADVTNYAQLHTNWLKVLDTKELNKTFFQELANWYFWAIDEVEFPDDEEKNDEVRNATSVIRLITRLMFVWFLKEKGLVSERLFDERYLRTVLRFNDESCYYKAILQNLFFATLNSDMGTRKFIADASNGRNNQHFVHNVFRYKREFKKPDETLKELFDPIPFLNGGLFECLDKEIVAEGGKTIRVRVDGFSDHKNNSLAVPDDLFFGAEDEIDLNGIYGTKNKRYKVRGLINILDSYKFTIAENTPLEEEIALDPELLGKVFENLLASYNPETKTTARKQTGSFYTPREIVNYMVDESLIAYLKQKLQTESEGFGYIAIDEAQTTMFGNEGRIQQKLELPLTANRWNGKDEELEATIRELFSYSDEANPFNETETEILIKAIDNCKILDPACGSGAFPMGILHRLVHLLGKLDPDNSKWKQWQKQKAIKETEKAFEIGDVKEREDRLIEINKIFSDNSDDYGRKLFLIENCIYGVDIQPIAIQIAKLRFFISLIVDQKANKDAKDNLGIRPLPNLETKFVAANTLIGLEAQGGLKPTKVNDLEKQLKEVRARHFGARTRRTKEKYREKDKEIRLEIADLLKQGGIKADVANQISEWNPYDQNASAGWFNAEYMFGIEKGFDIVIGNPPYGVSIKGDYRTEVVKSLGKVPDYEIYYYFVEVAQLLLRDRGIKSYIIPNTFLFNVFAANYRKTLLDKWDVRCIVDCTAFKLFEGATIFNAVTSFSKGKTTNQVGFKKTLGHTSFLDLVSQPTHTISKKNLLANNVNWGLAFKLGDETLNVVRKIKSNSRPLEVLFPEFSQGLIAYDKYQGQSDEIIETRAYHYNAKVRSDLKKWLWGEDVTRFKVEWNGQEWIDYCDGVANRRQPKFFRGPRLLIREITNPSIFAAYTETELYHDPAIIVVLDSKGFNIKCLLGILNSTISSYYHFNASPKATKGAFPKILVTDVNKFPIPKADDSEQTEIAEIVDKIIGAKKQDPTANTDELEAKIDELVYKLYGLTDEEIAIVEGRA